MSNLVRDDIRLGEIAGRMEPSPQFLKETRVQIYLLIRGAIERSHCRLREAACGTDGARKQNQFRLAICTPVLLKNLGPRIFGVTQNCCNEVLSPVVCRAARIHRSFCGRINDCPWIDTKK